MGIAGGGSGVLGPPIWKLKVLSKLEIGSTIGRCTNFAALALQIETSGHQS